MSWLVHPYLSLSLSLSLSHQMRAPEASLLISFIIITSSLLWEIYSTVKLSKGILYYSTRHSPHACEISPSALRRSSDVWFMNRKDRWTWTVRIPGGLAYRARHLVPLWPGVRSYCITFELAITTSQKIPVSKPSQLKDHICIIILSWSY